VLLVPAMHTEMWLHAATAANVATLRSRGVHVLDPASGRLTGADTGPGRLPEPEVVLAECLRLLGGPAPADDAQADPRPQDLAGRHVVVSAGGTREPLDPVRFLGNHSSGKQGYALARRAAARGARVTLVAANTALGDPDGVRVVRVGSALELQEAVTGLAADADAVVMAAAVADFRPARVAEHKIKKSHEDGAQDAPVIELVRNPDVLADLAHHRRRPGQVVVGFAAETGDETGDVLALGRAKLARKGCDVLVVNEVGAGRAFGTEDNTVTVLTSDGGSTPVGPASKDDVADEVWDAVVRRLE
jgi:phosphopantothenoylcysteine decarboxylase/phosphopantothenate--cysteine ligase